MDQPVYRQADCEFQTYYDEPECGFLTVPLDRAGDAGRTARIHVAVFRSWGHEPEPDPVVFIDGGPGANTLDSLGFLFGALAEPFLEKRDVIFFDQRGTGYSRPSLDCPEVGYFDDLPAAPELDVSGVRERYTEDLANCRAELGRHLSTLASFSTREIAADLEDLRKALGYEKWNLFGMSYGTKVALTAMRDFPGGIRSAVLDSAYPPEVNLFVETAANLSRSLSAIFRACENDKDCADEYPNLEETFRDTVNGLEEEPVEIELSDPFSGNPNGDTASTVVLDGSTFVSLLHQVLYDETMIPQIPDIIYQVRDGDTEYAGHLLQYMLSSNPLNIGLNLSVQCAEEVAFTSAREVETEFGRHSVVGAVLTTEYADWTFTDCKAWDIEPAPADSNEVVRSDIPALILAGEYDPITPPAWGKLVAENQRGSFFFEFPAASHGVTILGRCARKVMADFVDNPSEHPDARCRERIPAIDWVEN